MPKINLKDLALGERFRISAGMRVGVGVSGGADSVGLLRLMLEAREELGIVVCVAHFNHKLRGKASDGDEKFVARLAEKYGLEFLVAREDVGGRAKREKANLEDAGRRARSAFFSELVKSGKVSKVAVAHTADDQAETVLAHILRGTGLAGLAGIHEEHGAVFRPLLKVRRAELRAYLRAKKQTWREDKSNQDTKRTRARIRKELLPLLERRFQNSVVEHLCNLAELAREDEQYLGAQAAAWEDANVNSQGAGGMAQIGLVAFSELMPSLKKRVVRRLAEKQKSRTGQLSSEHVEAVLELAERKESGKRVVVPGGVEVRRDRDCLLFVRREVAGEAAKNSGQAYAHSLHLGPSGTELRLEERECRLHFRVIDWPAQGRETKITGDVLDREKLRTPLVIRSWQAGDGMKLAGHQKRRTLARLWNEAGVSRWEKAVWPVLTSEGHLVWAKGLGPAADYAVSEQTRSAVLIALEEQLEEERG